MILNRQLILAFTLVFSSGFFVWLIAKDYPQKVETQRQLEDIESKIEALKKEEERQKSLIEYLNSESYLEKQARLRLNFKKEGEEVVFIYRKDDQNGQQNTAKDAKKSLLSKLKDWIKVLIQKRN